MHVRILSYNIHRAIGVDRRFRPRRVLDVLAHHDADVVLLQEVDDGAPRSRELDLARLISEELDYRYYAVGHNVTLRKGRYGNATLSRYPILRERNIDLTIGARKRRGCQHTTIRLTRNGGRGSEVEVFNLHLGLSSRERARQVGLLAHSREFAGLDPTRACVVGGDFNDWTLRLDPIFTEILDFRCATRRDSAVQRNVPDLPVLLSARPAWTGSTSAGPCGASPRGRVACGVARVASDHLPVVAEFELPEPRGGPR